MNINGYIAKFKDKSFMEMPFNDVDALIFSELGYVNVHLLMEGKKKIKLKDIDPNKLTRDVFYGSVDSRFNRKMLNLMINSKRYKNIYINHPVSIYDKKQTNQFYAFNIEFIIGMVFVVFRGTDITLTGWREDCLLAADEVMKAQEEAHKYTIDALINNGKMFYLGGHSKGGNLAFYAALNLIEELDDRFIKAYSFDGPGFKKGIKDFPAYERVKNRLVKYLTYHDVIGSIYNNITDYKVVYSNGLLLGGHDPFYWKINDDGNFKYAKELNKKASINNLKLATWLDSLSLFEIRLLTDAFFKLFNGYDTIYDVLKGLPFIVKDFKKNIASYTPDERSILSRSFKNLLNYLFLYKPKDKDVE